jgi:hypothetical protein
MQTIVVDTRRCSRGLTVGGGRNYPGGPTPSIVPGAGGARAGAAGGGVESSSRGQSGSNTRTFLV